MARRPRKPKSKSPGSGLCCRRCGQPTRVALTRRVEDFAVDRLRVCTAAGCGWRGRTVEQFAGAGSPRPTG